MMLARQVLSKLTNAEKVKISREMILLEAPDTLNQPGMEQILVDILGAADHGPVIQAATDLLSHLPTLARAALTPGASRTLLMAIPQLDLRDSALQILGTAGYIDKRTKRNTLETLLSQKRMADLTGAIDLSRALSVFMTHVLTQSDGRDLLRDIFNEAVDYTIRVEALTWLNQTPQVRSEPLLPFTRRALFRLPRRPSGRILQTAA